MNSSARDYPALLAAESLPQLERTVLLGDGAGAAAPPAPSPGREFLAGGAARSARARPRRPTGGWQATDIADILFTSGTTGQPKGVLSTHEQNVRVFRTWSEVVGLTRGDRYLGVNPFFHSFGYKAGWLACLLQGATLYPLAVFDAGRALDCIERDRISVLPGPPTIYQSLLAHESLRAARPVLAAPGGDRARRACRRC